MELVEIKELLKKGFNVAMLADAFNCSIGRINELKCEPVEGQVYHKADINADALIAFAQKHEIDLDAIDFEDIVAKAKTVKEAKSEIKVGDATKFGKVMSIQKIGNSFVYLIDNNGELLMKSTKDMK